MQADGCHKDHLRTASVKVDFYILLNTHKSDDSQLDFRVVTKGIEIGVSTTRKDEASNKEYVSLSIAAPEFGPKIHYGNFSKAASSDDKDLNAVIWIRFDQTKAPAHVLHRGNHLQYRLGVGVLKQCGNLVPAVTASCTASCRIGFGWELEVRRKPIHFMLPSIGAMQKVFDNALLHFCCLALVAIGNSG